MSATPSPADETVAPLAAALVRAGRARSGRRIALPDGTASGSMTPLIDRRAFLSTLAGGLLAAPRAADGQQAGRPWKIGLLAAGSLSGVSHLHEALRQGLRELGYTDGQNVTIETRAAEGRFDRLRQLAV